MNTDRLRSLNLAAVGLGAFLIWWGIVDSDFGLFPAIPAGTGWVGVGLILLGVNAARWRMGTEVSRFTLTLGILALALGALKLARPFINPELPILGILLILLGGNVLAFQLTRRSPAEG